MATARRVSSRASPWRRGLPAAALLGLMVVANPVRTSHEWLTIAGEPRDPGAETLQVDPTPLATRQGVVTMHVRVNRAAPRTNPDGVVYRSFDSTVQVDCNKGTARYLAARLYEQPLWAGEGVATQDSADGPPLPVHFEGMQPDPTQRIIRATCQSRARP